MDHFLKSRALVRKLNLLYLWRKIMDFFFILMVVLLYEDLIPLSKVKALLCPHHLFALYSYLFLHFTRLQISWSSSISA